MATHTHPISSWVDSTALEACARAPERGPRVVFFSGGTALRSLAARLPRLTHRSIHLVTPFDSGGSSAEIRRAFGLPAVGDCRNRLLALSNGPNLQSARLRRLLARRLPAAGTPETLRWALAQILAMAAPGKTDLDPARSGRLRADLETVTNALPPDFDLRRASLGNLALAGSAIRTGEGVSAALATYERLLDARGAVRPVSCDPLHLAAELEDGQVVVGQHRLTGKELPAPEAPIQRIFLTPSLESRAPVTASPAPAVREALRAADLIVYGMGSFYTSLIAALQPTGIAEAIAAARAPKVYVPNAGMDPEMRGLSLTVAVTRLLDALRQHVPALSPGALLSTVLIDPEAHAYLTPDEEALEALGVRALRAPLSSAHKGALLDPNRLAPVLVSLATVGLPM